MANVCDSCGKKLSFSHRLFYSDMLCNECRVALDNKRRAELTERNAQLARVERSIKVTRACTSQQFELLRTYDHKTLLDLYFRLYNQFVSEKELVEHDIAFLRNIQRATGLTDTEIHFEELVKPYYYVNSIRNEGTLPTINLQIGEVGAPILRSGEVVYYGHGAALYEIKTIINNNPGGVQGVNFRVTKGVNYRAGAYKNAAKASVPLHVKGKHASSGVLVMTNKRFFLHPSEGRAPISISLKKVLNFNCNENGILMWIEGRQKTYFFAIPNSGAIEIFGLCLIFLLDAEQRQQRQSTYGVPNSDRYIPQEVVRAVFRRDHNRCVKCGAPKGGTIKLEIHHKVPYRHSGSNTEENLIILCEQCHQKEHRTNW